MEKSNLLKILVSLNPKEFKEFGDYIYSPFFNNNESIRKLYDYLKKHYPDFEKEKVEKEFIHKKIFAGVEYNDDFMRMLIFNMTKLAEGYLAYLRMVNSQWEMKRLLSYELNERRLDKPLEKLLKKTLSEIDKIKKKSGDWYLNKYYFLMENVSYLRRKHINQFEKFLKDAPLTNMHEEFTAYYLITFLKMQTFMLNTKQIYRFEKGVESFEKIIDTLDQKFLTKTPLIEIYYNLTMMLYTDKEEFFYAAKSKVFEFENEINPVDTLDILINLQNFCKRRIRKGILKFSDEVFDMYVLEVERELYDHYGYIHDILFKNIVEIGMQINKNEWVINFVEKYKKQLHPQVKDDVYNYSKAYIAFVKAEYESALEHLSKVKLYDMHTKIEVKELSAKIYFELKMEDMLYSLTDTFRHLISNSKFLTGEGKTANSNFIKYIKALYKVNLNPDAGDIAEIKQMMKNEELVSNRLWLTKKVLEIEARIKK